MKKIIIGLIMLTFITGCNKKEKDTLTLVTEAGFAPYEYYENSEIVGIDVDIAREIALAMNKELRIKDIAFDSIINEIKSGKADIAAAGMSITEERLKEVDFSIEYATSKQVVIVKKNSNVKKPSDIKDKKIAVQLGTVADLELSKKYKNITRQKKYLAAIEDLKTGKVDCVVMDSIPAEKAIENQKELVILNEELFSDTYGMAVKKGNKELLKKVNDVLKKLIEEGKIVEYTIKHTK